MGYAASLQMQNAGQTVMADSDIKITRTESVVDSKSLERSHPMVENIWKKSFCFRLHGSC